MRIHKRNKGVSLLEVMIAVMVFSVGMLGMAGLMLVSQRTNHSAFLRTQASFLAQSMADRMRSNIGGVWAGLYTSTGYPETGGSVPACTLVAPCNITNIATRDRQQWSATMQNLLPGPTARINCTRTLNLSVPAHMRNRGTPYDGVCTIVMTWKESALNKGADAADQSFAWVFQP